MSAKTKISLEAVMAAAQAGDCKYTCEACGEPKLYGAEEILLSCI